MTDKYLLKLKAMWPYLLVIFIGFYLLPLMFWDEDLVMFLLIAVIPAVCFLTSLVYGIRQSFSLIYVYLVAVLFAPTIFIFYNYTAWPYILIYAALAAAGSGVGMAFQRLLNKNKKTAEK